jgi:hypothetical protein
MPKKVWMCVVVLLLVMTAARPRGFRASASVSSPNTTDILFSDTFSDGDFDGWTVVDAPGAVAGPSDWSVVQAHGSLVLMQDSNINTPSPPYEGTHVYAGQGAWTDYHLDVDFNADDNDGVFVLFRYSDGNNYYRFMMDQERSYRRLEKKISGSYTTLAEDLTAGYGDGWQNVHIAVSGDAITVSLNFTPTFTVSDDSLSAGMIGLGTWASTGCSFDNVIVATTAVDPYADAVVSAHVLAAGNTCADPTAALGRPRTAPGMKEDFLSIGGPTYWVVFDMGAGEEIVDGPGNDLRVYEVGYELGGVDEEHDVYVSNSPTGPWTYLGQGVAVSELDLTGSGLSTARYVRIEDLSTKTPGDYPGSDIDAVQALHMMDNPCVAAPTDVNWAVVGNDVHLSWSLVSDAAAYNVYATTSPGSSGTFLVNPTPITATNYVHSDAAGEGLFYSVTSIALHGCESGFSSQVPYRVFLPLVLKNQ